jgi:hypothetical protein
MEEARVQYYYSTKTSRGYETYSPTKSLGLSRSCDASSCQAKQLHPAKMFRFRQTFAPTQSAATAALAAGSGGGVALTVQHPPANS